MFHIAKKEELYHKISKLYGIQILNPKHGSSMLYTDNATTIIYVIKPISRRYLKILIGLRVDSVQYMNPLTVLH